MLKNKKQKDEARAYVRVSTFKDSQKDSPEHQEGLIRETAITDGIKISKVYLDRGTATNIIEREDVQQMIQDAKNGDFDTIYFASLSRFSRDTLDAISLKRIIVNALGIRLVSIEDLYDSAKEDNEMIFTIISSVNQKQSETTSTASKRGIRQSAKKGNFTGSIAPFGYKKVNIDGRKTLEVVQEDAEIVKQIFDMYVNKGMGTKAIAVHLNEVMGIKSPKGGMWGLTSIQRMLENENYTGYLTFSKSENQKFYEDINDMHNRSKKLVRLDSEKWERTEFMTHEAIINKELYDEAQDIRLNRGGGKRGGNKKFINVFAKMIFCKDCGAAMVCMSSARELKKTKEVRRYTYLMCSKHRRQGDAGCGNSTWIPYEETRDVIINGMIDRMSKTLMMEIIPNEAAVSAEFGKRDFEKELRQLDKIISDNRMLLFEIRKSNILGEISKEQYDFEKEQYEIEINSVESKIAAITKKSNDYKDHAQLESVIKESIKGLVELESFDDVDNTRGLLMRVIDKIDVSSDGNVDVYSVLGKI